MSFIRRYQYFPGVETITQIEGVIIVDSAPPGAVNGISTGVVAVIAEFACMASAVQVDGSGNISTRIQPQEIFGSKDLVDKMGGFDETIGEFGVSMGNGFVAVRNKQYSRLICVPVNLCSARGIRIWRQLPTNKSQTDLNAIIPTPATTVLAGTEFRSGSGRLRLGVHVAFTALDPISTGTGASFGVGSSAATQNFTIGSGTWDTLVRLDGSLGARKGDILVAGYNSAGVITPAAEGGTYRVAADAGAAATTLSVEKLDGSAFSTTSQTNVPWRLHQGSDADSGPVRVPGSSSPGGYAIGDAGGYSVAVRPLTTGTGTTVDGTWASGTALLPANVPPTATGGSYDALSGLAGKTYNGGTLAFTAAVQGVNAAANASIDAAYSTAIDTLLADKDPQRDVNIVTASRKSSTINTKLKSHVLEANTRGIGRVAVTSPPLSLVALSGAGAGADAYPGVGAARDESVFYSWPGCIHYVPEAVNFRLRTADGLTTVDGILDEPFDGWLASLLSNLAPERNPGQTTAPVPQIFAPVQGLQRGAPDLGMPEYTFMRQKGISGLKMDRTSGPIIQSGITTSLISGQKNINRRRFAFFVQDSMAARLVQWGKLPYSNAMRDGALGELVAFCEELLSPDNPPASRISAYSVDDKSGNQPSLTAKGIVVYIVKIQMTPTADFIVLQTEVGEGVRISVAA